MVKLKTFEISLSAHDGLYMTGDILQGHVTIDLKYPMKMQGQCFKHVVLNLIMDPPPLKMKEKNLEQKTKIITVGLVVDSSLTLLNPSWVNECSY